MKHQQQQPATLSETANRHLRIAAAKLAVDDCRGASQELWLAGRKAAVCAARRRNWPADTDAQIQDAILKMDAEYGDGMLIAAGYSGARMFHHNAAHDFLEKDDIVAFQAGLRIFIDRMLTLDAPASREIYVKSRKIPMVTRLPGGSR